MVRKRYLALAAFAAGTAVYTQAALSGSVSCNGGTVATKQMPVSGANFASYCKPCIAALRTYAREPVIDTLVAAYGELNRVYPKTQFLYGEIGFPDGGRFRPHKTHREGLSVDLMVPLKDGRIIKTGPTNRYGYDVEFDSNGKGAQGTIDFKALGLLIVELDRQAKKKGGKVRRVFFAPDLQPELKAASPKIIDSIRFNKKQSWVRHDDHIHVDFKFPCRTG